jgi:hypothetical protein
LFSFSLYIFLFIDIIKTFVDSIEYFIESDQSFKINLCEPEPETISFEYDSEESEECLTESSKDIYESSQSESIPSSSIKRHKRIIPFEDKKKVVDFWISRETKGLSLSSISTRFRFVTSIQQIYEFEKLIESHGSRNDKLNEIRAHTFLEFKNVKDNNFIVHSNLQRWAIFTLKISLHLLHSYGDLKAITGLFQEKLPDSSQVIIQEKSLILLDLPICL